MSQHQFKTEISQLLNLVIHSLYSNKDIFLRELISNASDAIDRGRFETIGKQELLGTDHDWKIKITPNATTKTLTISDNGIGMSQEEVSKNIGTIASSGTRRFLEEAKKNSNNSSPSLIGQFGVGFYAAFMVASKVELITRRINESADQATIWTSTGEDSYSIATTTKESRGTDIVIHLGDEYQEYLDGWKIRKIIKKFSDFVEHPIYLETTEKGENDEVTIKEEVVNSQKAIWQQSPSDITPEAYTEFYKHVSHDWQDQLETIHWNVEGTSEFRALVFIPKAAPFDMFNQESRNKGIQLYVRRVFITDSCESLSPVYLRFLKGVVDSSDLPLNVSRELLQEDRQIRLIRKNLTKKVLDTLKKIKENDFDKYKTFWSEFGATLKEGIHLDIENREKIQELMIFKTNKTDKEEWISLEEYVNRMPENQKEIYYLVGETVEAIENSPHLEALNARNFEVLYMTDPIDDWVLQSITEYKEKKLKSIEKGDLDLGKDEAKEKEFEEANKNYEELLKTMKESLGEQVKDVKLSQRLTDSSCCLVANEHDMGVQMEKILRAMKQEVGSTPKRILELNPSHPAVKKLLDIYNTNNTDPKIGEYAALFFDQALLTAGLAIKDPLLFAKRISNLMS